MRKKLTQKADAKKVDANADVQALEMADSFNQLKFRAQQGMNRLLLATMTGEDGSKLKNPRVYAKEAVGGNAQVSVEPAEWSGEESHPGIKAVVAQFGAEAEDATSLTIQAPLHGDVNKYTITLMGDKGATQAIEWDVSKHPDEDPISRGLDERLHQVRPRVEEALEIDDPGYHVGMRAAIDHPVFFAASDLTAPEEQETLKNRLGVSPNPEVRALKMVDKFNTLGSNSKRGMNKFILLTMTGEDGERLNAPRVYANKAKDGNKVRPRVETVFDVINTSYHTGIRAAIDHPAFFTASDLTDPEEQKTLKNLLVTKAAKAQNTENPRSSVRRDPVGSMTQAGPKKGRKRRRDDIGREATSAPPGPSVRFAVPTAERPSLEEQRETYNALKSNAGDSGKVISFFFKEWTTHNQGTDPAEGQDGVYFVTPAEMDKLGFSLNSGGSADLAVRAAALLGEIKQQRLVLPIKHEDNVWTIAEYDRKTGEFHHSDVANDGKNRERAEKVMGYVHQRDWPTQVLSSNSSGQGIFVSDVPKLPSGGGDSVRHVLGVGQGVQDRCNGANIDFELDNSVPFDLDTLQEHVAIGMVCDLINSQNLSLKPIEHNKCFYEIHTDLSKKEGPAAKLLAFYKDEKKNEAIQSKSGDKLRVSSKVIEEALPFSVEDIDSFKPAAKRSRLSGYEPSSSLAGSIEFGGSASGIAVHAPQSSVPFSGEQVPSAFMEDSPSEHVFSSYQGDLSPPPVFDSWKTPPETSASGTGDSALDESMYDWSDVQSLAASSARVGSGVDQNLEGALRRQQLPFEASYASGSGGVQGMDMRVDSSVNLLSLELNRQEDSMREVQSGQSPAEASYASGSGGMQDTDMLDPYFLELDEQGEAGTPQLPAHGLDGEEPEFSYGDYLRSSPSPSLGERSPRSLSDALVAGDAGDAGRSRRLSRSREAQGSTSTRAPSR